VRVLSARRNERHGRDAEAAADSRAALEADPLDRAALFGLGQALVRLGQVDEGRALLERHRALIPLLDRLDDARRTVDKAPYHGPNHAALGDVLRALGRTDEAGDAYRAALARTDDAQRVPIVLRLARLLREDLENLDAAVRLLAEEAAHPATAADPRLHVRAGDYLMEAGRSTEALQHYLQAERMRPDDPPILERVQRARRDSGVGR
jgi:tetratricopeptide (TPR) repeat protein